MTNMSDQLLAAIDRVHELAPSYGNELQLLRRLVEGGAPLEDAGRLLTDQLHGGKHAREAIALVEAEISPPSKAPRPRRFRQFCVGSRQPPQNCRNVGPLPEVQCPTCQRFLVVPLSHRGAVPNHVYLGRAA